ncbi:hypothetical protein [Bacillus paranthracis]|uniref:hypothetical protein n=2 Tax=Bacillaceae TaxID=186817 RepID=UPI0024050241|nr:hypothetical protein [Bacillus paranthracis]
MRWLCHRLQVSVSVFYDYLHRKTTAIQKKRKKTAAYIVMQFKRLKGRLGYRNLYHYLINKFAMVSLSQVRQALCQAGLKSKVVTYYKKRKQEHYTFPNVLERSFKPGMQDVPTVVCNITEVRLANGMKVYFCAALDIGTRRVLGYSLDTHQDAQLVKDSILQYNKLKMLIAVKKGFYFIVIKDHNLPVIGVCVAIEQNHATSISGHYSRIKKGRFFNAENLPL